MRRLISLVAALLLSVGAQAQGIRVAGIDHVGITVPDLQQAQAFFADTFGCTPVTHIGPFALKAGADSVALAMLRCGSGANIELFEYQGSTGSQRRPKMEDLGAAHIAFYTDDVRGGVAYLKARGITVLGEPMTMTSGDTAGETWVHFLAPWGAELELVGYPQGKGYETTTTRRLWNPAHPAN